MRPRAVVLGSGIVGLWTADVLSDRGYDVTVLAKSTYRQTTSAAAVCVLTPLFPWDPEDPSEKPRWDDSLDLASETLQYVLDSYGDCGCVDSVKCFEFGKWPNVEDGFPVSRLDYLDFTQIDKVFYPSVEEKHGVNFAIEFECSLLITKVFLPLLISELREKGVRFDFVNLRGPEDVPWATADIVINCLGHRANEVFPDGQMYKVRGQSVFISDPGYEGPLFGVAEGDHAVFRHSEGIYIGSFFRRAEDLDAGEMDWDLPLESLWEDSKNFVAGEYQDLCAAIGLKPALVSTDEIPLEATNAGLRPFRKDGPRIEPDHSYPKPLVHNYGHGAQGWTIGYASAVRAADYADVSIGLEAEHA